MVRKRENIQWAAVVWMKMSCWCQRRMDRLVRDDRKATVTQITSLQPTYAEYHLWTHNTSNPEADGLQQQKTTPVPLRSDKNSTRRIQFTQTHQNWTIEDWKNVPWSDESRLLMRHSDGRVRIWCKHESMDLSCLVSMVQAGGGGVMVSGYFLGTLWAA